MINTNILVSPLTYEQKYEKILKKKSFQSFCWKINNPVSPLESKVKRQTMVIADSHLDLQIIFITVVAQGLKSRVSCSKFCLNTETLLLKHKTERQHYHL